RVGPGRDGGEAVRVPARRILLAANMWVRPMLDWFGLRDLPIKGRANLMIVTERMRPVIRSILRVVEQISLKQTDNGTFLIGGDAAVPWSDDPEQTPLDLDPAIVLWRLGIAAHAIPALCETRMLRTWHGWDGYAPDNQPLVGPIPGVPDAYVMACMRSGWTAGPYAGKLMAQTLLGQTPDRTLFIPEFDPARLLAMEFGPNNALKRKERAA
ncbi:MAG: FAD-binding oxidoreductase, partial [Alphaproteobacteria bacterium]|nr:FAD-binding oxidoreductase [Alphaproteobacteria bacterium]